MSEALSVIEMVGMQHENQYGHGSLPKVYPKRERNLAH
jgi:hypothetical protein